MNLHSHLYETAMGKGIPSEDVAFPINACLLSLSYPGGDHGGDVHAIAYEDDHVLGRFGVDLEPESLFDAGTGLRVPEVGS